MAAAAAAGYNNISASLLRIDGKGSTRLHIRRGGSDCPNARTSVSKNSSTPCWNDTPINLRATRRAESRPHDLVRPPEAAMAVLGRGRLDITPGAPAHWPAGMDGLYETLAHLYATLWLVWLLV